MNLIEEHKRVTSRRADLFARGGIHFTKTPIPLEIRLLCFENVVPSR